MLDQIYDKVKYLTSEKVVLKIVLIIILERSKFIHILTLHNFIILVKSFANKNENKYYYNMYLEKGSNKYKSNEQYF